MSSVETVQRELEGLELQDKLHVFDIHTDHNLHPPQDSLPRVSAEVRNFLNEQGQVCQDLIDNDISADLLAKDVDQLLKKPSLKPARTENTYPITDYFISSVQSARRRGRFSS